MIVWSVRPLLDFRLELARLSGGAVEAMAVSTWDGREVVFTATQAHDFDCLRYSLHDCLDEVLSAWDARTGEPLGNLPGAGPCHHPLDAFPARPVAPRHG